MAKELGPKCKKCRREGEKLFLKGDKCLSSACPMLKRNYPPGLHGPKGKPRLTEYGQQLREKQKAKRIYNILERQFSNYYKKALIKKGKSADNLFELLESRLDNVVYRLNFAKSRNSAKQLVSHKHFTINGKSINIPSYKLKIGDEVSIKEKSLKTNQFTELQKIIKKETPEWLTLDTKEMKGKVVSLPSLTKERVGIDFKLIIEFYSR